METLQVINERIKKIKFFSMCGKKSTIHTHFNYQFVNNWSDAEKNCNDKWDNLKLEARNKITSYLHENWPEKYREWNAVTLEAKGLLKEDVLLRGFQFIKDNDLDENIYESIEWDLLSVIMESYYEPYVGVGFYTELLKVYESGHIPCGWKGKWPEGKLLIY
ncbi:hypothetical protein FC756_23975 [Lysinibacillus mangiferihumi]|uniref:Cytoplasmic protein n=1 Tax=Lysinibacillus mangiferihumi TaxID=1130819 RepID=A0A4U2XZF5_9BACI|nr:hypothetical protein [Lysinibacillus mangiferihumi]TKI53408.1 hypothetical protein FC756_23975 [Lysinibacillus mangiferihumi]